MSLIITKQSSPKRTNSLTFYLRKLNNVIWFLVAWGLLIAFWELFVYLGWLNGQILPPPSVTIPYAFSGNAAIGFGQQHTSLIESLIVTLMRVSGGLFCGSAVALVLSISMIELRFCRRLIFPLVQTLAPISPVAWIPFTIAVIGIGGQAAIFIVFIAVVTTMTLSFMAAIDGINSQYINIAKNLGCGRWKMWYRVRLPAIAMSTLTSLRMAFFGAWMAVLAGEMAGINSGLGYMIIMAQQMFNMPLVMVGILTIGFVGFIIDRLLLILGHSLARWGI